LPDQNIGQAAMDFIAQHSRDVVARVSRDGLITHISPSIRNFGHEPQDLIGTSGIHLVHPDDRDQFIQNSAAMLRGQIGAERREHRFLTGDGEWVWIEGNPYAVRDETGEISEFINVFRDVTHRRGLEERARDQAELFEAAFEYAAIGKALIGLDGSFLRVNRAFCQIVGRSEAAMLNLDFQTITHPADLHADLEQLQRLNAGAIDSYAMDKRYIQPDGVEVWVHLTVSMVRRADGSPKHYVAQVEDLSGQRAAEHALAESEQRYRLIAENTGDMIMMTDLEGITTYATPSVARTGWTPEDLVGGSFGEHTHPDDAKPVRRVFSRLLKTGQSERVRWRGRHRETGEWIWLESNPSLLRDGRTGAPVGFLDAVRDVSVQVAQEAALAEARVQAEAAAAAKSQFLANMSHEIRTPLTAVLGFTRLLREVEGLPDAAQAYVGKIAGAGNGLLAIVNDILDFSKLEAGRFEVRARPVELVVACRETLELFSGQAEAKGLTLAFETAPGVPQTAMLDGDRLRQMLINLLGNAVKFTEAGGVVLRLGPAERPGEIVIDVVDTGAGLSPAAQAALFQRFTQIDGSMTRQHGGTGLGLAICRGIAEAMGGAVSVESELGVGSTFRIVVPAPAAELPAELAQEHAPPPIDGLRIFVVDDNAANRELARRILQAAGAEVEEADSGEAALERLALAPHDVVLMDLRMPGLDGRGALKRLREAPGPNQDIPVLVFTADADLQADGDLAGFDGLVRKPIQPLEMYMAIARATEWTPDAEEETAHVA
jgi:PAS domain S-box-containing protein